MEPVLDNGDGHAVSNEASCSTAEELGVLGVGVPDDARRPERGFGGSLQLRKINELFYEEYKKLDDKLQEVVGHYLRAIGRQSFAPTKKYVSDVISGIYQAHSNRIVRHLRSEGFRYPGRLLIWVQEEDHIHIAHDCPWSNGSCRCQLFNVPFIRQYLQRPLRKQRYIGDFDRIDYYNVILYFIVQKWTCPREIWIGGRLQRLPSDAEIVQWQDLCRESARILEREGEGIGYHGEEEFEDLRTGKRHDEDGPGAAKKARREAPTPGTKSRWGKFLQQTQSLLEKYLPIPAVALKDVLISLPGTEYLHDPKNVKHYETACSHFTQRLTEFSFQQFHMMYDENTPLFYANNVDPFVYYHNIPDSVRFLDQLLNYQIGDVEHVREFLMHLRDWFNREGWNGNPKINAIAVIGPPNSGKNYFFDAFCALAYNVGHIGRVNNKTNTFALQECVNRRIIVGNEISMEEGAKEDFKKLCEGTALNVRVKYQADKIYSKTPVCLIANYDLDICSDPTFKNVRLVTFHWNTAPFLKESTLKPYPLAIYHLYNKYGVDLR